jgi:hypothetical protein
VGPIKRTGLRPIKRRVFGSIKRRGLWPIKIV